MEARVLRLVILLAAFSSLGAGYRTTNFVVNAPNDQLAQEIGQAAEAYRRDLSIAWLGYELPQWKEPCPIRAQVGNMGAGGVTQFNFARDGGVFGWQMAIQGSHERILDSVLPHEVTHTIFASHFKRPLPRWADEGACTTVEHSEERAGQQRMLVHFLQNGKGISFTKMFAMMDYPPDMLPLYAQGYSLARFFIEQGGRRKFVEYVGDGLAGGDWEAATAKHYGYQDMFKLQDAWLAWVRRGSPKLDASTLVADAGGATAANSLARLDRAEPAPSVRDRNGTPVQLAAGPLVPVARAAASPSLASMSDDHRQDGWRTKGQNPLTEPAMPQGVAGAPRIAAGPEIVRNQVTRPPSAERSQQVILQWAHEPSDAAQTPGNVPLRRRSIYDTSRPAVRGLWR